MPTTRPDGSSIGPPEAPWRTVARSEYVSRVAPYVTVDVGPAGVEHRAHPGGADPQAVVAGEAGQHRVVVPHQGTAEGQRRRPEGRCREHGHVALGVEGDEPGRHLRARCRGR